MMDIFVVNDNGALDLKDVPNEDDFERFWHAINPFFKVGSEDSDAVAYMAAKTAWKQATMMNTFQCVFKLYWLDKKEEMIIGLDIQDAFRRAGYGGGALNALNYYEEVTHTEEGKEWKKQMA
jgi:hypothetical protein